MNNSKVVTINKIAQIAGVSRGTVDRALNGRKGINSEVAKRIIEIAKIQGYQTNIVANALAKSKQNVRIGVIVNKLQNSFFDGVIAGIEDYAKEMRDFGVQIILKQLTSYEVEQQILFVQQMKEENINALLITPITNKKMTKILKELVEENIPVVTCNTDIDGVDRLCYIGCDYYKSGSTAANVAGLIMSERADIGLVTGSLQISGHVLREKGFRETIQQEYPKMNVLKCIASEDDDIQCYSKTKQMLKDFPKINMICFLAAGLKGGIEAIEKAEKKIKVVAFDLTDISQKLLVENKIHAIICQQPYEQGYRATKALFDFLRFKIKPKQVLNYTEISVKVKHSL